MVGSYVFIRDEKKELYKVLSIEESKAKISGVYLRIIREIELNQLITATNKEINEIKEKEEMKEKSLSKLNIRNKKFLLGKVLHIDGDNDYLIRCTELYKKLGIYSYGIMMDEIDIPKKIKDYILKLDPDIVVITGHDSYNNKGIKDLSNYTNTKYFCDAIKIIRTIKSKSDVVIIAGACQSNFEALIASGANFASSPKRINIHTFDPLVLAVKAATTDFKKVITLNNIDKLIENGGDAFGGVETLGKMRGIL